jgi:rubrerythrin
MDGERGVPCPQTIAASGTASSGTDREAHHSRLEFLLHAIEKHIDSELQILPSYRDLAASTADDMVKLVMNVVVDDEERHHQLMRQIVLQLKDDLGSSGALPKHFSEQVDANVYAALRRFVMAERETGDELRSLASDALGLHESLPFELLTAMAMDRSKHEHLLRFLFRHVGRAIAERGDPSNVVEFPSAHRTA